MRYLFHLNIPHRITPLTITSLAEQSQPIFRSLFHEFQRLSNRRSPRTT
jgi:hypothetical protein